MITDILANRKESSDSDSEIEVDNASEDWKKVLPSSSTLPQGDWDRSNPQAAAISATFQTMFWQQYLKQKLLMQAKPRKGGQIRFTNQQTVELEGRFKQQKYLAPIDRRRLAAKLDLSERQVKTWFQNRRAKWRRLKLPLVSSYDFHQQSQVSVHSSGSSPGKESCENTNEVE
ncbi:Hematopoietically-expressed homeobox protein HHEX -like protein [Halotydeus destructor]|nr:Hematopoietically-expressed homeobox protein HHEX -like protein [Halotydeus destructor]